MFNPGQPTLPRVQYEDDIPSEDSTLSYDGRFNHGVGNQNLQYNQPQTISTSSYEPVKRTLAQTTATRTGDENFNYANYPEGTVVSEKVISYEPIPSANVLQPKTINMSTQETAPITPKDIRVVEKHVPLGSTNVIQTPIINNVQTPIRNERSLDTFPVVNIPLNRIAETRAQPIIGATESVVYNPPVTSTTTVTQVQTVVQPQYIPLEGVSEIAPIDDAYMRNSVAGRQSETQSQLSRWQAQNSELSSVRYQNHQTFENWETNRRLFFDDRINVMDDMLGNMEKRLEWLEVGAQKVILFFKERETQEVEFSRRVKHGLTQLGDHFSRSEDPIALGEFSAGMKESDAFHAREKQNSEIMAGFIKKDILDWILIPAEKEYKLQATSLRNPLNSIRKKIGSVGNRRARGYNKYFKSYDSLQKSTKLEKKDGDLFKKQLKYSLAAREELRLLRLYNEQGIVVINEFSRLATHRMAEIQRAFSLYLQKYMELYQNTATPPGPILDMVERSCPEAVTSLFQPPSVLLSPSNQQFMATQLGRTNYGYTDLNPFLVNFPESIDPARSSFVFREWEAIKLGNILKKDRACTIVATTGNNLMIIEKKHEESELGKIKHPFQMRYTKVEDVLPNSDGTVLTVVERAPGTLFQHKSKAKLKFETPEDAQDFLQYVSTSQPATQPLGFSQPMTMNQPTTIIQPTTYSQPILSNQPATLIQPTTYSQPILSSQPATFIQPTTYSQPILSTQPVFVSQQPIINNNMINTHSVIGNQSPITRNY